MSPDLVASGLSVLGAASLLLSGLALAARSWAMLWAAALFSLVLSLLTGFSIGGFIFLVTCLQLGGAVVLHSHMRGLGWAKVLLGAVALWGVVVIVPLFVNGFGLPWLLSFPLVTVVVSLYLLLSRQADA